MGSNAILRPIEKAAGWMCDPASVQSYGCSLKRIRVSQHFLFVFQGTSITSTSSDISLHMRSVQPWARPPRLCCSLNTLTSSVIRPWRICSQSSLEAPVRLSHVGVASFAVMLDCDSNQFSFMWALYSAGSHFMPRGPRLTSRDWRGIRPPIDATIVGRVHLTPKPTSPPQAKRRSSRRRRPSRKQRRRHSRSFLDDLFGYDDYFFYDSIDVADDISVAMQDFKRTPMQNVYFFKEGVWALTHFHFRVIMCFNRTEDCR